MKVTPLVIEVDYYNPIDILGVFHDENPVLLESTLITERGRYSFLALSPFQIIQPIFGKGENDLDVFQLLKQYIHQYPIENAPDLPPFQGGIAGYFGYEFGSALENVLPANQNDRQVPDVILGLYDLVLAWDHILQKTYVFSSGYPEENECLREIRAKARLNWVCDRLNDYGDVNIKDIVNNGDVNIKDIINNRDVNVKNIVDNEILSNFTKNEYQKAVQEVQEFIRTGDIFQANLSQRFQININKNFNPLALYAQLSKINPAPFSAYLSLGNVKIISASPERLISLKDKKAETCPIKGTIARSSDTLKDRISVETLSNSAKDRAENIMIVDLLRNDLSRVCLPHSVNVKKLCSIESFATLHHLVSVIEGTLAPQYDALDLFKAVFPGGSVTGAPKIRAMEIIAQLEPVIRGPYCGSMGYMGFNGDMDLSILIRTFVMQQSILTFHAGGAITLNSDPVLEFEETLLKAAALKNALLGSDEVPHDLC